MLLAYVIYRYIIYLQITLAYSMRHISYHILKAFGALLNLKAVISVYIELTILRWISEWV